MLALSLAKEMGQRQKINVNWLKLSNAPASWVSYRTFLDKGNIVKDNHIHYYIAIAI